MADTTNEQTFTGIDAAKWARIQALVKTETGIEMETNVGAGSAEGLQIAWVYDPTAQTLDTTLVKRSWYDPPEVTIEQKIAAAVEGA
jgi:hypothetical protein